MDVVVVQSFGEDGESGKQNEGREELHDGLCEKECSGERGSKKKGGVCFLYTLSKRGKWLTCA
jgi:hypothetical protein